MGKEEGITVEVMEAVENALKGASEYGLEVEVMSFAFMALKDNPNLSIDEAISMGIGEWLK